MDHLPLPVEISIMIEFVLARLGHNQPLSEAMKAEGLTSKQFAIWLRRPGSARMLAHAIRYGGEVRRMRDK